MSIPRYRRKAPITIDRALFDPHLLGAALNDPTPWRTWLTVLRAAFGLPLDENQLETFHAVAGERDPPHRRVRELWCVIGRRGGKSRMAAATGVYLACFADRKALSRGEVGEVAIIAASREQANIVFKYVLGFLEASPVLRQEIEGVTAQEVRLRGNVVLSIRAGNYRTVRGRTLLAAIIDEAAFMRDETSAYPDLELYRALLPALATTGGMLVGISTPYRRVGLLHQKHRDHFGMDDADVLVVSGSAQQFNPILDVSVIERARASDPEAARSEWDAEFRSDLSAFLDEATIEAAIARDRPLELPPRPKFRYVAFCDPSGGRHDAFTLCIGHKEGENFVADVVRGFKPPFDPHEVTKDYAALAREYRVSEICGDRYSAEWVVTAFKDAGVSYRPAEKNKSELYLEVLPLFTRAAITIPDLPQLTRELRLLERATHKGGRDNVDHPRNGSDDFANALCGAATLSQFSGYNWRVDIPQLNWINGPGEPEPSEEEKAKARAERVRKLVEALKRGEPIPY